MRDAKKQSGWEKKNGLRTCAERYSGGEREREARDKKESNGGSRVLARKLRWLAGSRVCGVLPARLSRTVLIDIGRGSI